MLATYVPDLKGGGLEPVGRAGLSLRRLARYEADSNCEYLCFQGGLLGGIVVQLLTFLCIREVGRSRRRDFSM